MLRFPQRIRPFFFAPLLAFALAAAASVPAAAETHTISISRVGDGSYLIMPFKPEYEDGEIVAIRAIPEETWVFLGWSGTFTSPDAEIDLTMDRDYVLTATFEQRFTLEINSVGNGLSVDVSPVKPYYVPGDVVTVTAYDGGGYRFTGWGGTVEGATNPLVLHIDRNHRIDAYSSLNREPVFVDIVGEGEVTRDPDFPEYLPGTRVDFFATPAEGWRFVGWTGRVTSSEPMITVEIVGTTRLTATFEPDVHPLTVQVFGEGTVTRDPDLAGYPNGTIVHLFATPAPHWHFYGWEVGNYNIPDPGLAVEIDGPTTITATFLQSYYTLTLEEHGPGYVQLSPAQDTYLEGTEVTLIASDMDGNTFLGWGGDASGSENPLTIVMDRDMTISATWTVTRHAIDVTVVGEGEVLREPDWPAYPGGVTVELTPVPAEGWMFGYWADAGEENRHASPLYWEVIGNASLTAIFKMVLDVNDAPLGPPGLAPIAPNPARGDATLTFSLATASRARITVLDVAGRLVGVIADRDYGPGTHRLPWNVDALARSRGAGLYFVRLEAGTLRSVRRVAVTR